jgi:hypothetical protein
MTFCVAPTEATAEQSIGEVKKKLAALQQRGLSRDVASRIEGLTKDPIGCGITDALEIVGNVKVMFEKNSSSIPRISNDLARLSSIASNDKDFVERMSNYCKLYRAAGMSFQRISPDELERALRLQK